MGFLEVKNVSKRFAKHTALNNLSIDVPENSIFGLLGPNGAGKTTLLRIITQIFMADEGSVKLKGKPITREDIARIGYLPEERGLYKKMKIGEQAMYLSRLKGISTKDAKEALKKWFIKFGIENWWDKKVEELSKGMQQKVQFIVTILHKPELIIFDEPFSGFDPINANLLKEEILNLRNEGATIIFSTHNMASVEELCDNIALINNSRKILEGSVTDIKNKYKQNIYEVEFRGSFEKLKASLTAEFELLEVKDETSQNPKVIFKIKDEAQTNELIKHLLPTGKISSFREIIPTMNDIFIQNVQNESQKEKE